MPLQSHSSRFYHPDNIGWEIHIILHSPVTSSVLGPNVLLNTLFSNTLSLRSYLSVSDQVSHPYKTTDKIIFLYILIFNFWIAKWKTKILHQIVASIPWLQSALNFSLNSILICWDCPQISEIFYPFKEWL
jgi:hypothetical protein